MVRGVAVLELRSVYNIQLVHESSNATPKLRVAI